MPLPAAALTEKLSNSLHGRIPPGEDDPHVPEPLLTAQLATGDQGAKLGVEQHDGKGHGGAGLDDDLDALEDQAHGVLDLVLADAVDRLDLVAVADDGPVGESDGRAQPVGDGERLHVLDPLAREQAAPPVVGALEARLAPEHDRAGLVAEPRRRAAEEAASAERREDRVEGLHGRRLRI